MNLLLNISGQLQHKQTSMRLKVQSKLGSGHHLTHKCLKIPIMHLFHCLHPLIEKEAIWNHFLNRNLWKQYGSESVVPRSGFTGF